MIDVISCVLIFLGAFLCFTSALGCIRFKGFLNKMHAVSIGDSLGCPLMLIGIALNSSSYIAAFKITILVFIILVVNPMSSYILNLYALRKRVKTKRD